MNDKIVNIEERVTHANLVLTDLAALFNDCKTGITFFITGAASASAALPEPKAEWMYSQGLVLKRNLDDGIIMLFGRMNGKIAIDCVSGRTQWSGWQIK